MEFKQAVPHAVMIRPTMNQGFLVEVGCAHFAFGDTDTLLEALKEYLEDPEAVVKAYNDVHKSIRGVSEGRERPRTVGRFEPEDVNETCEAPEGSTL